MLKFMFGMLSKFLFGKRLSKELTRFFGTKDLTFPIQSRAFSALDLPNIQLAIEALAKETGATDRRRVTARKWPCWETHWGL